MTTRELLNILTNQAKTNADIEEKDISVKRYDFENESQCEITLETNEGFKKFSVNIRDLKTPLNAA